jgi:hypothetical protein
MHASMNPAILSAKIQLAGKLLSRSTVLAMYFNRNRQLF